MKTWTRALLSLVLVAGLTACGFAMRGTSPLPFDTLYLGVNDNAPFGAALRRALLASSPGTRIVQNSKDAQVTYVELQNSRSLREVSLNAVGRVEQYELTVHYAFRLIDARGRVVLNDTQLSASRELPYDDQFMQGKDADMQRVYEDLELAMVSRIVRRISAPEVRNTYDRLQSSADAGDEALTPAPRPAATFPGSRGAKSPDELRRESGSPIGLPR